MKKLFYIVLVIVALMVVSRFIKEHNRIESTIVVNTADISEPVTETLPDLNCICDTEPACNPGDENCNPDQTKSTCDCKQPDGETVTIEETVEDVEETNPEETADDGETIVSE